MWLMLTRSQGYPVPSVLNVSQNGELYRSHHDPGGGDPDRSASRSVDVSLAPVKAVEAAIKAAFKQRRLVQQARLHGAQRDDPRLRGSSGAGGAERLAASAWRTWRQASRCEPSLLALLALAVVAGGVQSRHGRLVRRASSRRAIWEPSPDRALAVPARELRAPARVHRGHRRVDLPSRRSPAGSCVRPDVFDIDLYVDGQVSGNDHTVDTAAVRAIHDRGAHAVCYMSAGTAERFRPDYRQYVAFDRHHDHSLLGKPFSDRFANEYWLNLDNGRGQRDFILRRVEARTQKCARAGFDGVEYDVVDAYAQGRRVTGWQDHRPSAARLRPGVGRDRPPQRALGGTQERPRPGARGWSRDFDFAINEQCFQYRECTNNPAPGLQGVHPRRQAGVPGRVPHPSRAASAARRRISASARSRRPRTSPSTPSPGSPAASARSLRNQLARVHDPGRVEALLERPQGLDARARRSPRRM